MIRSVSVACVALTALVGCSSAAAAPQQSPPQPVAAGVLETGPAFEADFTGQPDGAPADPRIVLYDNSRDRELYGASANGMLTVVDGALQTQATEGIAAGYAQVDLGAPVTHIGAEFTFTGGAVAGGAISLPVWAESFAQTWPRKPASPSHLVLDADSWGYGVYENNQQVVIAEGVFDPPLPSDTLLRLDIRLAGDLAAVELPDGTTVHVTDPRIAAPAQFATFESFQMDAATMARVRIVRAWADV